MKSILLLLVPVLMLSASCKKEKLSTADKMTFCSAYGMRATNEVVMYEVDRVSLRKDDHARFVGGLVFSNMQIMPQDKYMIAKDLLDNVPKELISSNNRTFGSPGSHDQGGYVVIIEKDGTSRRFDIDEDNTSDQSKAVIAFKQRLADVMRKLQ